MSQELAFAMSSLSLGSGKKHNGQLKLPSIPKDESQFFLWKLKVQSTIEGIGSSDVIRYPEVELHKVTLQRIRTYQSEREALGKTKADEKIDLINLTQEQKDILKTRSHKVYAALAETLTTAEQSRTLYTIPLGDAYALWHAIAEKYDIRTSDANKERLWEVFNALKMDHKEDYRAFKARVEEAAANLSAIKELVPESRIKARIISGLSTRYAMFVGGLYSQDISKITVGSLNKMVQDYEESATFKNNVEEDNQALAAYVRDTQKADRADRKHKNKNLKDRNNRSRTGAKKDNSCFTCNKKGHYAYDCYANKDKKKCSNCRNIGHTDDQCKYPKKLKTMQV
jgi:hypothetical protein